MKKLDLALVNENKKAGFAQLNPKLTLFMVDRFSTRPCVDRFSS